MKTIVHHIGGYVVGLAGVIWLLSAGPGWYHVMQLHRQVSTLRRAVATLHAERDTVQESIDAFRGTSPGVQFARERHAREMLQLVQPGEVVYLTS